MATKHQTYSKNNKTNRIVLFLTACLLVAFSNSVFALNKNIEEAIAIMKKAYPEQCQKNKLKIQLLIAHRKHDQARLKELGEKLDEINIILKPTEDKLKTLKTEIKKNPNDEADFNTALLDLPTCE